MSANTPAAESVARSLAAHPGGITARDLAMSAKVANSTAAKILVAMEAAGTATRTTSESNGRKAADIWHPATTDDTQETRMTDDAPTTDEILATDDAPTADEILATDDTATTDEAPATDETPTTDDTATTDETPATDETSATDDTATTDEVTAADEPTTGDDGGSNRIVESHMAKPGETVHFEFSGDSVTNIGDREAGIFLTMGGTVVADVPVTVTAGNQPTNSDSVGATAPVSGAPVSGAPSGSADHFKIVMVAGILGDHPDGVGAAVVTDQSGLRAPVVARVLAAMEVAGAAVRKPGGSDDAPELWVRGEADLATVDLANAASYRECVCTCGHKHRVKTGVTVTTAARRTGHTTGEINTDGSARLGKNGLRNQVEAFLRDLGPGHDVTPGTVARELGGRSSGAVLNAMARLTAVGVAVLTSEAPVKYALADDAPAPGADVQSLMTRPVISADDQTAPAADETPVADDTPATPANDEAPVADDAPAAPADDAAGEDTTDGADTATDEA